VLLAASNVAGVYEGFVETAGSKLQVVVKAVLRGVKPAGNKFILKRY
jgi:hypothetical protein